MTTNKQKVAVIGLGNIGKIVAAHLVNSNREVILVGHRPEDATALVQKLGKPAKALSLEEALREATIIVMAVPFNTISELLKMHATAFEGKIIVDPSNPIAPDGNGGFKKIIGANNSAGEILAGLVPKRATLVKALGTLGAASLESAPVKAEKSVLFYATDNTTINAIIDDLIKDCGFEPVYIGGIDQSIRIEVFGELHEYGSLGKTVSLAEAMSIESIYGVSKAQ